MHVVHVYSEPTTAVSLTSSFTTNVDGTKPVTLVPELLACTAICPTCDDEIKPGSWETPCAAGVTTGEGMIVGVIIVPGGNVIVPEGEVILLDDAGRVIVPEGDVIVPAGVIIVPTGGANVPVGNVIVPEGIVIMPVTCMF